MMAFKMKKEANTIIKRMEFYAEEDPEKDAFVFVWEEKNVIRLSRQQIWTLAGKYASVLRSYGVQKGDIICNTLPNSRARLITDLGIIMAGAATLNGQILLLDGQDIFGSLRVAGCKMVVTANKGSAYDIFKPFVKEDVLLTDGQENRLPVSSTQCPALAWLITIHAHSHDEISLFVQGLQKEKSFYATNVTASDLAYVFTTSGSTGYSKLVPRTHWEAMVIGDQVSHLVEEGELFYSDRPLGWIGGYSSTFFSKGTSRYLSEQLPGQKAKSSVGIWNFLLDCGVTSAIVLPTELELLAKEFDAGQIHKKFRMITTGGQPMKKNLHRVAGTLTEILRIAYGSTEIGLPVSGCIEQHNKMQDSFENNYTGILFEPDMEICFMDEALNKIDTPNKEGKVFFRGHTTLRHYLNKEQSTTGVFTEDGWFDTGDIGFQNENGHIFITGRASDSIEHGPCIVYPGWLEERIQQCPGVIAVIVVGIPHPSLCEELCACVVRDPDAGLTKIDLLAFCNSMFASDSPGELTPVPEKILFVDGFPVNANGKVSRKEIKQMAVDHFGVSESASLK